jgi:membrane protease subunit HflK
MSRRAEQTCLGGLVLQTVSALGCFLLVPLTNSWAVFAEAWHLALGIGIWLVALLHLSFRRKAAEERLDEEAIRRRQGERAEGIFGPEGAADQFSAQARLARVEKWLVPIGSLIFAAGMIVVSALLISGWGLPAERIANPLGGIAALATIVFLTFLVSRYAVGQSQEADSSLLRGPGSYMLFNTLCSALVAIALTFAYFGSRGIESVVAWIIVMALGLIGIELVLTFIANLYRPRQAGREPRAPYDSRVLGLLSMPRRILRSAAETLDYQFGFKVSETWFFRFLERALAPLILFGLLTFYLLWSFMVVPAGHLAFIERFGVPRAEADGTPKAYGPGLHVKWPWPIEIGRVVEADRVQEFFLGVTGEEVGRREYEEKLRRGEEAEMPPVLWTTKHYAQEYNLLVATDEPVEPITLAKGATVQVPPVSLLTVSVPVQFVVRKEQLYRYVYGYADVAEVLEAITYRELVQYVAGADLIRILGPDRQKAGKALLERFQKAADDADLGVDIIFVGLHGVHPPQGVAASFEARVNELEERLAAIRAAERHAERKAPEAEAEETRLINEAKADRFAMRTDARARALRFATLDAIDRRTPTIFRLRWYLSTLEEILPGQELVIAPPETGGAERIILDLKKKPSVIDLDFQELLEETNR